MAFGEFQQVESLKLVYLLLQALASGFYAGCLALSFDRVLTQVRLSRLGLNLDSLCAFGLLHRLWLLSLKGLRPGQFVLLTV